MDNPEVTRQKPYINSGFACFFCSHRLTDAYKIEIEKEMSCVRHDFSFFSPVSDNSHCITSPQAWTIAFDIFVTGETHTGKANPYSTSQLILVSQFLGLELAELLIPRAKLVDSSSIFSFSVN